MVVMAAAAGHFALPQRMMGREVRFHLDLCVAVHAQLWFRFDQSLFIMDRVAIRAGDIVERMVPKVPICSLERLMAVQASLRGFLLAGSIEAEDFFRVAFLHMLLSRSMAGFTTRLVPHDFKGPDAVMHISHFF